MQTCPICLDPCPRTLQCANRHSIHGPCLLAMIQHTGRKTCPYCAAAISMPFPPMRARVAVAAEHALYAVALAPLLLQARNRSLWVVNGQMLELRLRCGVVPPVVEVCVCYPCESLQTCRLLTCEKRQQGILSPFRRRMRLVVALSAAVVAIAAWRSSSLVLVGLLLA